ncbi:hypothetical protein BB347_06685 [Natronorubrum daqingense]|nr:hypothetical protein BB347_06685 [Natronorubrum daqingense]
MVAVGSTALFLVAVDSTESIEHESEQDRIENGFIELGHQMASASSGNDVTQSLNLDVGDEGTVASKDTGNIHIQGEDVDTNVSIGAIEYESNNGEKVAYQAGGVFHETMDETQVKSSPPIHYDDQTLSFPIVELAEEGDLNSGDISLEHEETENIHNPNTVEGETVSINVTSQYYLGWKEHFEQTVGDEGDAVQDYGQINESHGYVDVEFGLTSVEAVFENAVVTDEKPPSGDAGGIHGTSLYGDDVNISNIDSQVTSAIADANESHDSLSESESQISSGDYYVNGDLDNDDYNLDTIDISNGNVSVFVDGSINVSEDIQVTGWEEGNEAQIYTTGDLAIDGDNGMYVGESAYSPGNPGGEGDQENIHAKHLQIYGTSDFRLDMSGNDHYEGIIYAPGGTVTSGGTPTIYGSVVVGEIESIDGASEIIHDNDLDDSFEPRMQSGGQIPPEITYLNVVKHELTVEQN